MLTVILIKVSVPSRPVHQSRRKPVATYLMNTFGLSQRRTCNQLTSCDRTGYRYESKGYNDQVLRARLKELAAQYSRYGYLLLHGLLKAEGTVVNKSEPTESIPRKGFRCAPEAEKLTRPMLCDGFP